MPTRRSMRRRCAVPAGVNTRAAHGSAQQPAPLTAGREAPALPVRTSGRHNFGLLTVAHRARQRSAMPRRSLLVSLVLSFLTLGAGSALAQGGATPFSAEKMWSLDRLGDPTISPDGKLAVMAVTRYDIAENKGLADLWILP